uniref:Hydroxyproline-rich glycoprotein family protein n=1 Tax=Tanacetum cinerariifolium TaxID=118510 RepID=A0A6L2KGK1_TANCI|nr:hypothetical protein [Tanacetum cinerariifolium]
MDTDKVIESKDEPRLSGSYVRSLVKHLTTTTTKDPLDSDGQLAQNVTQNGKFLNDVSNTKKQGMPTPPPQQHKKQVRRRLHNSKPYQERLLNMAEARREIVTALKFHRASMKQQESSSSAAHNHDIKPNQYQSLGHEKKSKSRRILSLYPSNTTTATTTLTSSYSSLSFEPPLPSYWPISTMAPPPPQPPPESSYDNLNFVLPSQTLGLNLNFQNFQNLETNLYHKPMSIYSPSSSSSTPEMEKPVLSSSSGLHHAMDDEEMEEIRSLGEQHQIEWNDTVNLVSSARWCSFLQNMEIEADESDEYDKLRQFDDQVMEFPSWLINANESSCLEQNLDDRFSDAYFQDSALPCMDIGEIEAMDGEWLA